MPLLLHPAARLAPRLPPSPPHSEEWKCRFCSAQLPDYRKALSQGLPPPADCALASIHHEGKVYSMQVRGCWRGAHTCQLPVWLSGSLSGLTTITI